MHRLCAYMFQLLPYIFLDSLETSWPDNLHSTWGHWCTLQYTKLYHYLLQYGFMLFAKKRMLHSYNCSTMPLYGWSSSFSFSPNSSPILSFKITKPGRSPTISFQILTGPTKVLQSLQFLVKIKKRREH